MSAARDLAKLGNQDALTVDTTLTRVGINSSNPTATLDIDGTVQVGTGVTVYSASGIVSATKYYADSYYGSGVNLTGVGNTDNIITGTAATFNNKVNINSTLTCSEGINVSVGVITAPSASFSGNVTIGGTLTYEDVTDIDAVGLITARTGVRVTAGGLVVTAGVSTFSAPVNINSSPNFSEGLNVSAGVATFAGNQTVAGTIVYGPQGNINTGLTTSPPTDYATLYTGYRSGVGGNGIYFNPSTYVDEDNRTEATTLSYIDFKLSIQDYGPDSSNKDYLLSNRGNRDPSKGVVRKWYTTKVPLSDPQGGDGIDGDLETTNESEAFIPFRVEFEVAFACAAGGNYRVLYMTKSYEWTNWGQTHDIEFNSAELAAQNGISGDYVDGNRLIFPDYSEYNYEDPRIVYIR